MKPKPLCMTILCALTPLSGAAGEVAEHPATITDISTSVVGTTVTFDCPTCPTGPDIPVFMRGASGTRINIGQFVVLYSDPNAEGLKLVHIDWQG